MFYGDVLQADAQAAAGDEPAAAAEEVSSCFLSCIALTWQLCSTCSYLRMIIVLSRIITGRGCRRLEVCCIFVSLSVSQSVDLSFCLSVCLSVFPFPEITKTRREWRSNIFLKKKH